MRKTPAAAGLALLIFSLATPVAWAHPDHGNFIEWRSPRDGEPVSGGAVHIRGKVAFEDGVKSWAVEVLAAPGAAVKHQGYGRICEEEVGGSPSSVEIDCVWNTTAYPDDGGLAHNGQYIVRVLAENAGRGVFSSPSESHTADRPVSVVNTVGAPHGVRLSSSESPNQAIVRWESNPEPDIVRYLVQERLGGGQWQTVGETGRKLTTLTRRLTSPGTYRYQVAAVRSSGSETDTVQSSWSGPAVEPRQIVVAEPAPASSSTTTTTTPGPDLPLAAEDASPGPPPAEAGPRVAAGADGAPAAPGAAGPGPSRFAMVTPIQPGAPGSVGSLQTSSGNLIERAAPRPGAPKPVEDDGPYSDTLPYPKKPAPPAGPPDADGSDRVLVTLPDVGRSDDPRAVIVPLAGGLLLFVLAMLAFKASRRGGDPSADFE